MTEAIDLAIVGCGGMGRRHLHGLAELQRVARDVPGLPDIVLREVCDHDLARAEQLATEAEGLLARRPGVARELSDAPAAGGSVAIVATGTASHHELALHLLAAGHALLIEKPLTVTMEEAREVIDAANKHQLPLAVAENIRREPVNRFAHQFLRRGVLGEVNYVHDVSFTGGDSILLTPWRHQRGSGGILLDVGVHKADTLEYLLGPISSVAGDVRLDRPVRYRSDAMPVPSASFYQDWADELPESVQADAEDVATGLLRFASGASGCLILHQAAHGAPWSRRDIYGSDGTLHLPPDRSGLPPTLVDGRGRSAQGSDLLEMVPDYRLSPLECAIWGSSSPVHYEADFETLDRKLNAVQIGDFALSFVEGRPAEVDGEAGARSMSIIHGLIEASGDGGYLSLDES